MEIRLGPPEDPAALAQEGASGTTRLSTGAGRWSPGWLHLRGFLTEVIQVLLLSTMVFLPIRFVAETYRIEGVSMEPNFHPGQHLMVNRLAYLQIQDGALEFLESAGIRAPDHRSIYIFGEPQRGDVIVFHNLRPSEPDLIKRIIGIPGDWVMVDRGHVYVNGVRLQEDYIRSVPNYSMAEQQVPAGSYFVLGDNRPNSSDSHIWGFVPQGNLVGKAWAAYWPPDPWKLVAQLGVAGSHP